jgi:hypothetical protein
VASAVFRPVPASRYLQLVCGQAISKPWSHGIAGARKAPLRHCTATGFRRTDSLARTEGVTATHSPPCMASSRCAGPCRRLRYPA